MAFLLPPTLGAEEETGRSVAFLRLIQMLAGTTRVRSKLPWSVAAAITTRWLPARRITPTYSIIHQWANRYGNSDGAASGMVMY